MDSVPKEPFKEVTKTKYGTATLNKFEPMASILPFIRYNQRMRTVEMEYIMPGTWEELQQEDSRIDSGSFNTDLIGEIVTVEDDFSPEEQQLEERTDSMPSPNEDQFYYEYLFGDYLREWQEEQYAIFNDTASELETEEKKKGIKGLFSGLFGKKKNEEDLTDDPDLDSSEELTTEQDDAVESPGKKDKKKGRKEKKEGKSNEKKVNKEKKEKEPKPKKSKDKNSNKLKAPKSQTEDDKGF
jgi:hypothetical protein